MMLSVTLHRLKQNTLSLLIIAIALAGCTKKEVNPDVVRLHAQLASAQKRLSELEVEITTSRDDAVTAAALGEEKELLRSRMARVKHQLVQLGEPSEEAAASGGGGHH